MTKKLEHLTAEAIQALELSDEERIRKIQSDRWIGYTRAGDVLKKMDALLKHPKTHRMPNLLIVADTNQGKTMIARRFVSLNPGFDNPDGETITLPALMIQAPPEPHEGRLYDIILDQLFAPFRSQESPSKKQIQVIHLFKEINLGMLIIDEIHHVLAGPTNKRKNFLNVIKVLGNEAMIPIVGLGIKDAVRAIHTDPQLGNRFDPMHLPRWKCDRDFFRLLLSFERMLPLKKPSNLIDPNMAKTLHEMSEGYLGELAEILRQSAVEAVLSGKEAIGAKVLKKIAWTPPSQRRKKAEGLV